MLLYFSEGGQTSLSITSCQSNNCTEDLCCWKHKMAVLQNVGDAVYAASLLHNMASLN